MMLIHRCRCGHPDMFHSQRGECSAGMCSAKCRQPLLAREPELIPTFTFDGQATVVVEEIHAPGVAFGSPAHPIRPCGKDCCVQMAGVA
jgi:hypothetical protein